MADDLSRHPENADEPEISASVTFMEIMRQAASRAAAANQPALPEQPVAEDAVIAAQAVAEEAPAPAMSPEDRRRYAAAMDAERIRRVQRRKAKRRRQAVSTLGGLIRTFLIVIAAAGLIATIFTWFTPNQFIASSVRDELSIAQATSQPAAAPRATSLPTPNWMRHIGIVAGHRGPEGDPGAVCEDGLKESDINLAVAQEIVRNLSGRGYDVDLLDEFDPRLENYQATALVSIHANTCQVWPGEVVSGFLIAAAAARVTARGNDNVLVECIAQYYTPATGLQRREGLTQDMTDYHTFREIHPLTPAAIIELGFMLADREILTQKTDVMAEAITNGILCFLEPRQLPATATPNSP